MRILVTGGTGFIGSHVVAALRRRGDEVVCLLEQPVAWDDPKIECQVADLGNSVSLKSVVNALIPCQSIIHLGARMPAAPVFALSPYVGTNVESTGYLLEKGLEWGVQSLVFASSITVGGCPGKVALKEDREIRPDHAYSLSKYFAELACEFYRRNGWVSASSLRITSPYGPWMNSATVLPKFIQLARESMDIVLLGTGKRTQNFVHISDVVRAVLLALETRAPGVYNVAGTNSVSMKELAQMAIQSVPGCTSQIRWSGQPDPQEDCRWDIDNSSARNMLGYAAQMGLAEGLKDYCQHLDQVGPMRWWRPCA